jgi:Rps23 Pro-64 3,4-dihydroxylase Tpa1-like proline 4-hydroxylase
MTNLWLTPKQWKLSLLQDDWTKAKPFPYVVFDELLSEKHQEELLAAFDEEPCELLRDEIFEFMVSAKIPVTKAIQAFRAALESPDVLSALQAITKKQAQRVELRGYAYQSGHYLLPHSDHQLDMGRKLAFAYYVKTPEKVVGGELELFDCRYEGEEIVETRSVTLLAPIPNRMILFHVGDESLHQVREVLEGTRLSISGWFY